MPRSARYSLLAVALAACAMPPGDATARVIGADNGCVSGGTPHRVAQTSRGNTTGTGTDGTGTFSTLAGCNADAAGQTGATAYGTFSKVQGDGGAALGFGATAGKWASATGTDSVASGIGATAVGMGSQAHGRNAVAIGGAGGDGTQTLSIADSTLATGDGAIAIGADDQRGAQAAGKDSIALGGRARADADNSIALGAGSQASRGAQQAYEAAFVGTQRSSGELNVGQRAITGVAAGSAEDDGVNVSQLKAGVEKSIQTARQYTDEAAAEGKRYTDAGVVEAKRHTDEAAAEGKRYTDAGVVEAKRHTDEAAAEGKRYTDAGVVEAKRYTDDAAEAGKRYTDEGVAGAIAHTDRGLARVDGDITQLRHGADGVFRVSQDDNHGAQAGGEQSTAGGAGALASGARATALGHGAIASGNNSVALGAGAIAERDNTVAVGAAGSERTISHVADGLAPSDAATVRQLDKVRDSAVHYDHEGDDINYAAVTLGRDAPVSLRNVAPGVQGTDAVNLAQLQDTTQRTLDDAYAYTDRQVAPVQQDVWRLEQRVDGLKRDMEAGIAAAMGLKQAPAVSGRTTYYAGVGGYRDQAAVGVSLRRTADNGRWSLEGGVSGNRRGVGGYIGVSGVLGR